MVGERTSKEQDRRTRKTSARPKSSRPMSKGKKHTTSKKKRLTEKKENGPGRGPNNQPSTKQEGLSKEEPEDIITRQFGLTPVPYCLRCKKLGQKTKMDGQTLRSCPSCQKILTTNPPLIPKDVFSRFEKIVNVMVRRGRNISLKHFKETGPTAIKKFHDRIKNDPQVVKVVKQVKLHNRLRRCAAQYAYRSIQEYKRRQLMVRELATILERSLSSNKGLSELVDPDFPSYDLIKHYRGCLRTFNETSPLELSTETGFLQNMLRHVRNILQEQLKTRSTDRNTVAEPKVRGDPVLDTIRLIKGLEAHLPDLATSFLRRLSSQLTKRVNHLRRKQGPAFGQGFWDSMIETVLGGPPKTGTDGKVLIAKGTWDKRRKQWRNQLKKTLAQPNERVIQALLPAAHRLLDRTSTSSSLINYLFQRYRPRFWSTGDIFVDWTRFLIFQLRTSVLAQRVASQRPIFHQQLKDLAKDLVRRTRAWIRVPVFRRQSIPLTLDDNCVYTLCVDQDSLELSKEEKRPSEVFVRLTVEPRQPRYYQLTTPARFFDWLEKDHQPLKPVLLKRPAGGALVLAIPFSPKTSNQNIEASSEALLGPEDRALSVDLGLKVLATISVTQGVVPIPLDPRKASEEALQTYYKDAQLERFELARYFLDQDQMLGKATKWYQPGTVPIRPHDRIFNFKRRLTNLQEECRALKKKLDGYRNTHRPKYRRHTKYFKLRREWKRKWQKIRQLHLELARQVATRLIQLARHHHAPTIRFEDLRWSQHSSKDGVGTWLATWQVHWFHSEIIRRTKELAVHHGLQVNLVYARHTSQRCSSCGAKGHRQGKIFHCPHCHRQLNSDLNAARNIALAPLSPEAIGFGGGPPFPLGNSGVISPEIHVAQPVKSTDL